MWECPKCKEPMHDYDDSCWNCRTRNPAAPEERQKPAPQAETAPQAKPAVKAQDEIRIPKKAGCVVFISVAVILAICAVVALVKPLSGFIASRAAPVKGPYDREVAYEEITEYDGKGGVKKSVKTYPQSKDKGSSKSIPGS